ARGQPRDPEGPRHDRSRQGRLAGDRDRARDAAELPRQQTLVVPAPLMRLTLVAVLAALLACGAASAGTPTAYVYDANGRLIETPIAPVAPAANLTKEHATAALLAYPKVARWLERYPKGSLVTDATYKDVSRSWNVNVWSGPAGEIATGRVDDATGVVTEAWTGPQVAWKMARGYEGSFGGKLINKPWLWLSFCAAFLIGLADWRRPL